MADAANKGAGKVPDPLIGRIISERYEILSLLAKGGMGRVYLAEQKPLGRQIALKVLAVRDAEDDPDFRRRFLLEASICARLKHPNTVTIFDYGRTEDEVYYIAMELLEGRTLRTAIRKEAPFDAGRAVHIAMQIARSLREAHGLGVIHRDLKPGNIYLVEHDEDPDYAKVLDFGLVKVVKGPDEELTLTGQFMGSPKYMPPEQIRGQPVDARSDIYALGAILYEMTCGRPPFERPAPMDVLLAHLNEPLPAMAELAPEAITSPPLEQVARRCLEKAPMDRFASMEELMVGLREAASQAEVSLPSGATHSRSLSSAAVDRVMASMAPVAPDELEISAIDTVPPLAETRRSTMIVGLALVAIVALGAGAAWVIGGLPQSPAPGTEEPRGPVPDDPFGMEEPPPIPATAGVLTLRSSPEGARVELGETALCPTTPCEAVHLPEGTAVGSKHTLRFHLAGHESAEVEFTVEASPMQQQAQLAPQSQATPTKPHRPRRSRKTGRTGRPGKKPEGKIPPEGYKDDPY